MIDIDYWKEIKKLAFYREQSIVDIVRASVDLYIKKHKLESKMDEK
jgi:hypothetical protein